MRVVGGALIEVRSAERGEDRGGEGKVEAAVYCSGTIGTLPLTHTATLAIQRKTIQPTRLCYTTLPALAVGVDAVAGG